MGILEEEFQEMISKISESIHRLTSEEEEVIKKISRREKKKREIIEKILTMFAANLLKE
jgi:phenylpyruvate tautomerase PptA (4-oxalocrotonate tautomerase family)